MQKRLCFIFTLLFLPMLLSARGGRSEFTHRLQFGVEWGYSQTFYKLHHYNIVTNEGYRINEETEGIFLYPNGALLANIGYDISERFNISLYSGYAGFADDCRVFPISLRLNMFPGSSMYEDGFYTMVEGGVGLRVPTLEKHDAAFFACIGEAYRIKLTPFFNLDFIVSLRTVLDRPNISNPDGAGYVSKHNIRSNNARYYALNFSVALNF